MNVPALRFPEFEGEWEEKRLGEFFEEFREKSVEQDQYEVLTSARSGLVRQKDYYDNDRITERYNIGFNVIPPNYLTYRSRSDDRRFFFNENTLGLTGIISVYYPVFRIVEGENMFFAELLARHSNHIGKYSVGTSQTVLSMNELKRIKLPIPQPTEQKKIAAFLGVVDAKIAALRARVAGLERYKRGLMKALFSQTLRFTKPDGTPFPDWEEKRLGDYLVEHRGGAPLAPSDFVERSEFEVIPKKAIGPGGRMMLEEEGTFTTEAFFRTYSRSTIDSSFLVTTLRDLVLSGPSIGFIVKFSGVQSFLLAQGVYGFKIDEDNLNRDFLIAFSNTIPFRRRMQRLMVGSTQVHIRNGDYFQQSLSVPHPDEQAKIAEALSAMDAKIAAVSGQLDRMQEFKKGLLQQMFV